jgi:hypothetical protein
MLGGAAVAPARYSSSRRCVVAGARRHHERVIRYPDGSSRLLRYPDIETQEECEHGESSLWGGRDARPVPEAAAAAPAAEPQRVRAHALASLRACVRRGGAALAASLRVGAEQPGI